MSNSHTPAQIEQFKRNAKRLAQAGDLSHAQALDQIASEHGYPNWSVLAKQAATFQINNAPLSPEKVPHKFLRTVEEMRRAMRKTMPAPDQGSSNDRLRAQIEDLSTQFISASNALDFAIAYMERALEVERFHVNKQSHAYYEMRCWLPYCVQVVAGNTHILLGRDYKPVGMVQTREFVDYAKFPQAHLLITNQKLHQPVTASREDGAEGYFYDASPWTSRKHAQTYLDHLKKLRDWLSSSSN